MIKTEQFYQTWAEKFTLATWNKELNIKINLSNRLKNCYGLFRIRKSYQGLYSDSISLGVKTCKTHEDMLSTLKHELCHWYCFEMGLNYRDGDADFEQKLKEVGACSTETDHNLKASELIQTYAIKGIELDKQVRTLRIRNEDAWSLMKEINHPIYETKLLDVRHFVTAYKVYNKSGSKLLGTIVNISGNQWIKIEHKTMTALSSRKSLLKELFVENELKVNG